MSSELWSETIPFRIDGTERDEDTLRVETNRKDPEHNLQLVLPTLCITYASMDFANAVGGEHEDFPAAAAYGPRHFDPPVVISGAEEVEKLTWIRGAHRVEIGPTETRIEWSPGHDLIIPRLRIDRGTTVEASLEIDHLPVAVETPFYFDLAQYADGRCIGGIRVQKNHPEWSPQEQERGHHDLWIEIVDLDGLETMADTAVRLIRVETSEQADAETVTELRTDEEGVIFAQERHCAGLEAATVHRPSWAAVARCFRPLDGQRLRLEIGAWRLPMDRMTYGWREGDSLADLAALTGLPPHTILEENGLHDPELLRPGMEITLPCHAATWRMGPGDTPDWLAESLRYESAEELAAINGLADASALEVATEIRLPGWHFFHARPGDALDRLDQASGLEPGWSRPLGRVHHHPDPRRPFESETIAIPTREFAESRLLDREAPRGAQ